MKLCPVRGSEYGDDASFRSRSRSPLRPKGSEAARGLRREAITAGRISHPNVRAVDDFGPTPEDLVYLAMAYLSMARQLARPDSTPP